MIKEIDTNNIRNYEEIVSDIRKQIIEDIKGQYDTLEKEIINIDKKECDHIELWNTWKLYKDEIIGTHENFYSYLITDSKTLVHAIYEEKLENLLAISNELVRQIFIRFDSYIQNILNVNETRLITFYPKYFVNLSD
jgi:hypothetical protein